VTYRFLPEAEAEYLNAISFYEERRPGLGAGLIQEFERTMQLASQRPTVGRVVSGQGIRRLDLSRFPYAIFFQLLADGTLQITAFAHHRRRPGYWLGRGVR
jgi:toxin ParE1/3/4